MLPIIEVSWSLNSDDGSQLTTNVKSKSRVAFLRVLNSTIGYVWHAQKHLESLHLISLGTDDL